MSKDMWVKHYDRRLAEAEEDYPSWAEGTRERWAELMADRDTANEKANAVDAAKDRGLT